MLEAACPQCPPGIAASSAASTPSLIAEASERCSRRVHYALLRGLNPLPEQSAT